MMLEEDDVIVCDAVLCMRTLRASLIGTEAAKGWTFSRGGKHFCPHHMPPDVRKLMKSLGDPLGRTP